MDNGSQRRTLRTTPAVVKNLRTLKVAVLHPDDADGRLLIQQLQRIGCQVQGFWPPPPALPEGTNAVFVAVRPDSIDMRCDWLKGDGSPTVIAVATYENPTIVEAILHIGAKAVLPAPVRSLGLLSTLVVAKQIHDDVKAQAKRLQKLEVKLVGARRIEEAKGILMRTRKISEGAAYDLIREQAMSKRVSTEDIAAAIINANEILSLGQPP